MTEEKIVNQAYSDVDYSVPGEQEAKYVKVGKRPLFSNPDADEGREHFHTKSKCMIDKTTTVSEGVSKYIHDGDYFAAGGFGSKRIPSAVLHEIVRQKKKTLGSADHIS